MVYLICGVSILVMLTFAMSIHRDVAINGAWRLRLDRTDGDLWIL